MNEFLARKKLRLFWAFVGEKNVYLLKEIALLNTLYGDLQRAISTPGAKRRGER